MTRPADLLLTNATVYTLDPERPWATEIAIRDGRIEPEALNETNQLELHVFASDRHHQAVLVARLDNLGKGASGAAVQNMRLMLGLSDI